jgi:hypothetical protein
MNHLILLLLLTVFHFVTGYGLLNLFNVKLKPLAYGALATMCGVVIASLVPFFLQLAYLPITFKSVMVAWLLIALALNAKVILHFRSFSFKKAFSPMPRVQLYEIPGLLIIAFMLFVSIWRCYYYPSYVRDALSGPETIAELAIREHTMINSAFSVNLETTNNQFKSPFLTALQIIYKFAGFPFGGVWLSVLVVSFYIFLYNVLCEKVHPVLAGLLLIIFTATPEAYGYTFMVLYDYSNMVFLFLGMYFLFRHWNSYSLSEFYFSAVLFAFAIFIRSETLAFVGMLMPFHLWNAWKRKVSLIKPLLHFGAMLLIGFFAYWLPTELYNNHYLPVDYKVETLINKNLTDLSPFWIRITEMTSKLMFGEVGRMLWGYFMYIFLICLVAELIFIRKLTRDAINWLIAVGIIYVGLPFLGFLLPLMDLDNTTKRGLFKILPLMLLYMANNQLLTRLSAKMFQWEYAKASVAPSTSIGSNSGSAFQKNKKKSK